MAYETIIVEVEDHICVVTLNRPDALNALNEALLDELADALEQEGLLSTAQAVKDNLNP